MKPGDDAPTAAGRLRTQWQGLRPRERRMAALASSVVALALLWWLALAPAVHTLRQAGEQRAALQAQAQRMQQMQREAEALKALPRMTQQEALHALQSATEQRLGASARLTVIGDRANVTLKDAPSASLTRWLADARVNARATPVEARLTRGSASAPGDAVTWNGTLSLSLPSP
jgi:general secretion pathway protein M